MIERFFRNPLAVKRWRRFRAHQRAFWAMWALIVFMALSLTAEIWANSKPIILSYRGQIVFPALKYYHPSVFGLEGVVVNYRALTLTPSDWALWPLVSWDPIESNMEVSVFPSPPSAANWLGTDDRGRDVLARLLYGFRYSLAFGFGVWVISFIIGTGFGAVMGFMGGRTDLIGQRVVEVFEAVPILLLLITLVATFGASLGLLVAFSVTFGWMSISVYMRAEFLKLRKREFVESARALGVSTGGQIFRHILPNSVGPLVTFSPFFIASQVSVLAILDYLGLGLPPPTPSWGELLQQAQKNFTIAWWLAVFPSLALFGTLVSLNLVGEGVRDAFDPKGDVV